jgi:hypothetical protein
MKKFERKIKKKDLSKLTKGTQVIVLTKAPEEDEKDTLSGNQPEE